MKRQFQDIGVKKWYGNHLIDLQDEIYLLIDSFFGGYGAHVVQGCEVTDNGSSWSIEAGLVCLPYNGTFRVCKFEATEITEGDEAFFAVDVVNVDGDYKDGSQKPIAKEYLSKQVLTTTDALTIKKDGTHAIFCDLVQAKAMTEAKAKEPAFDKKTGFNLDKSSSTDSQDEDKVATPKAVNDVKKLAEDKENSLPVGAIIMWAGSVTQVPDNWQLCDGTNGTPDMRGRFVVGYNSGDTDYNTIKKTGGAKSVTLTKDQMPSHNHSGTAISAGSHQHTYVDRKVGSGNAGMDTAGNYATETETTGYAGNHSHSLSINSTGGGDSHENRPPYLTLAFIMKVA